MQIKAGDTAIGRTGIPKKVFLLQTEKYFNEKNQKVRLVI